MKKISIFLVSLILLTSLMCSSVFAAGEWHFGILDEAELLDKAEEFNLAQKNIDVKTYNEYEISFYTGYFDTIEDFESYAEAIPDEQLSITENDNGILLATGCVGDGIYYYSIPYGEYSDTINDAVLDEFLEYDANCATFLEAYEMYVTLVQGFLEEQEGTVQETIPEETVPQETVPETAPPVEIPEEIVDLGGTIEGFDPLIDDADLFTDSQEELLFARIEKIHDTYDFDVTIITLNKIPDNSSDLRSYFDWYEGLDPNRDGLIVGANMDSSNREFSISTRNFGIEAFSDDANDLVQKEVPPQLTKGEHFKAFNSFLDYTEEFLQTAKEGKPYKTPIAFSNVIVFVIAVPLLIAMLIAWAIVKFVFEAQMKTAVIKTEAKEFMVEGSLALTVNSDEFTHITESRVYDPPPKKSSGGGSSSSSGYGGDRGGSSSSF